MTGCTALIALIFLAGCTGQAPGPGLGGTGWTLTGYHENGTIVPVLAGTTVTLAFGDDGKITGRAGCNHYFASSTIQGKAITIGQAGSTEMYCGTPGVMDQEQAYLALLGTAKTFSSEEGRLSLSDATGRTILVFARIIPAEPEPLVLTNWTLESFHAGDAVSSVISGTSITAVFGDDGQLSGSAGCNRYFARYNLSATSLVVGDVGSTKMNCVGSGVMNQEQDFLNRLKKAASFTIAGDKLALLDQGGAPLLTFRANA